jgi:hypothetical protein
MRFRPYMGIRFTSRGLRPYSGVAISFTNRRRPAHLRLAQVLIYHCSVCGHVNAPDSTFCSGCGAAWTKPPKIER